MNILDVIVGKPLKTSDERAEQIGIREGIPIFGLDALSSAAYGPEAALSLLIPLGLLGVQYIVPISAAIITLLVIVYLSYRQTIAAYPTGGGSYTVARYNLGAFARLLAAAALLTDYILPAAVGISAGVGALVSAVPWLQPHTVALCVGILVVITILNLRGVREAGVAFMVPTYLFVGTLLITIVGGLVRVALSGGHPVPITPPPPPPPMSEAVTWWLLLKVFASGCTALTGVEAVSNGVKAGQRGAAAGENFQQKPPGDGFAHGRRDSCRDHYFESAWRPRSWRGLHGAHVSLRRHAAHNHCWRPRARRPQRRASRTHH